MAAAPNNILGLDVGDRRVGVAAASLAARLPRAVTTLVRNDDFFTALGDIIEDEQIGLLVIGLPRDLNGRYTGQTQLTQAFADELRQRFGLPVYFQDEAVTSKQAEAELKARGKTYRREDIDALAATYILEDYLAQRKEPAGA